MKGNAIAYKHLRSIGRAWCSMDDMGGGVIRSCNCVFSVGWTGMALAGSGCLVTLVFGSDIPSYFAGRDLFDRSVVSEVVGACKLYDPPPITSSADV